MQNHDYFYIEMPKNDNKIMKYNYGENSIHYLWWLFIVYTLFVWCNKKQAWLL